MRNSYRDPHGRAIAIVRVDALEIGRGIHYKSKGSALPPLLHIGAQPRLVVGAGRVLPQQPAKVMSSSCCEHSPQASNLLLLNTYEQQANLIVC